MPRLRCAKSRHFVCTDLLPSLLQPGPLAVLAAGIVLSVLAGYTLDRWVARESETEFANVSGQIAASVEREMDAHIEALRGLQGLFAASDYVGRAEFATYAKMLSESPRLADVQGLEFARHVTGAERPAYEMQVKRALAAEGKSTNFSIWPKGARADYLVVEYVYSIGLTRDYAGGDLLSVPESREAIARARTTYRPSLSARFSGERGAGSFALVAAVVPHAGQTSPGAVQMIFRPKDMVESARQGYLGKLDVAVYESADAARREDGARQVYGSMWDDRGEPAVPAGIARYKRVLPLKVADREWALVVAAQPQWISGAPAYWLAPTLTASGIAVSLLLTLLTASLVASRQRAEARFSGTFDFAPVSLLIVDEAGRIRRANPKAEALFGYAPGELGGRALKDLLPESTGLQHADGMKGFVARHGRSKRGAVTGIEVFALGRDGRRFPVEVELATMLEKGVTQVITSVLDVSGRVEAARALQVSNKELVQRVSESTGAFRAVNKELQVLSRAVEQSPASILITDPKGNIKYVNPMFERVTGYSSAEVLGKNPRMLSSGTLQPEDYRDLWAAITAKKIWHGEFVNRNKDGTLFYESASISPILDDQGELTHFVSVKEDITGRKRIENELRLAKEAAEAANRAKSAFLANMSHELRTPLNAILGFSELLRDDADPPLAAKQQEHLKYVIHAGWHLLDLINDILDLAKIESGQTSVEMSQVDVAGLVDECINLNQSHARKQGVTIRNHLKEHEHWQVWADRTRLKQMLVNLLSNAIKYNRKGGCAMLSVIAQPAGKLRIVVSDTGPGIPADKLLLLFQPFSRLGAEKSNIEGSGIGLALTKRLAELMNGSVGLSSVVGEGTEFWIELNQMNHEQTSPAPALGDLSKDVDAELGGLRGKKILYIEDVPANRELITGLLSKYPGIQLLCADSGEKGLELIDGFQPDLLLLDMQLPGISGKQVLQQVRRRMGIPVLVLSADAMPGSMQDAIDAGAQDYLTKPLDIERFKQMLCRFLQLQRAP